MKILLRRLAVFLAALVVIQLLGITRDWALWLGWCVGTFTTVFEHRRLLREP